MKRDSERERGRGEREREQDVGEQCFGQRVSEYKSPEEELLPVEELEGRPV